MGNKNSAQRGAGRKELQASTTSEQAAQHQSAEGATLPPVYPSRARSSFDVNTGSGSHLHGAMDGDLIKSYKALNDKSLSAANQRLSKVNSREDLMQEFHAREVAAAAFKSRMAADWLPEYHPVSIIPPERTADTVLQRVTRISPAQILQDVPVGRKVKVVCTLGPSCWSEEGLAKLLDAGMNVARFNFSHGTHEGHQEVLDRLRKVATSKGKTIGYLLDTKGPEIRTAMLRGGKEIELEAGQEVTVVAVGDGYDKWEGYKDPETGETKIGLSYAKLCQSLKPGNIILIADGAISIEVTKVLNDQELLGKVINSHTLGQRKNCNLPGVLVDLPVLAPKDIDDVQNFCCKNEMDFVAASFVQTADDVRFIRKTLLEAGGARVQIISKIESQAGLLNIDGIIQESDGIMVARGDLAMEVPAEKIALAQKMIVAKCVLAGKFVITATQMLESMVENPLPTRAEMTDVANAVFDGTDAVMLSGETANGKWPDTAVSTMAAIAETAELAIDYPAQLDWIRVNGNRGPVPPIEATYASVAKAAVAFTMDKNGDGVLDASEGCLAVIFTRSVKAANLVAKYRPPCPVLVVSDEDWLLRALCPRFGMYPLKLEKELPVAEAVSLAEDYARSLGILYDGRHIIVVSGTNELWADELPEVTMAGRAGMTRAQTLQREGTFSLEYQSPFSGNSTICVQTVRITPEVIINRLFNHRSTKIIATLGPASWSPEKMAAMLDNGVSLVRINMSLCKNADHFRTILNTWKHVVQEKTKPGTANTLYTSMPGVMCSIERTGIRNTMFRGHKPLPLQAGQEVTLVVTQDHDWEGYHDPEKNMTKIGITHPDLCKTVHPGDLVLLGDGTIKVQVVKVLNDHEVQGKVLNSKKLSEARLVDLVDKNLNVPSLSSRDVDDLKLCGRAGGVDFVTLSAVQSPTCVERVRKILDDNGGAKIKIIAQIDNPAAVGNYDEILEAADGIVISRGHLGIRLPAHKVCLAQKWMITKANLKGKPVIVAAQLLESMVETPRPTRAEITDVANAMYDGADAILLRSETATGMFVEKVVQTAAAILRDAEVGVDAYASFNFLRNFTPKPMPTLEAVCSSAVKAALDMGAVLMCVVTNTIAPVRAVAKYRPNQAVVVCTTKVDVAHHCNVHYGTHPLLLPSPHLKMSQIRDRVVEFARKMHLAQFQSGDEEGDQVIVLSGPATRLFAVEEDLAEVEFVTVVVGDELANITQRKGYTGEDTIAYRSTKVGLDLVCDAVDTPRKTKIICTLGPKCWSEEGLDKLIDAGMNVARFNFSHGSHADHQAVLDRLRGVAASKGVKMAVLLDTKGPEIRTAMLRDHQPIELEAGQLVTVVAVGDDYVSWEGYKDPATGETKIGLSYAHLCQDVKVGGRILIGDGTITIEVVEITSQTELVGKVLNSKKLGERKNCNLPGVKVRLPVLTATDVEDVQKFACKNHMDFIAASFVQSADDVRYIRKILDQAGGRLIKIISKIESSHGLQNFDDVLQESDGIMVARGDLAMEIPSEKVALAQKMMITKANIAGKFIITATQMLESMVENPLPTRAEMTDVANAVFDGTDAVMLSGETANGNFPDKAVATMAAIVGNAEVGINYHQTYDFIRDFTSKPMTTAEAVLGCAAKDAIDVDAGMILVVTTKGDAARLVAKYRPKVPVLVVTNNERVVRQCSPVFALHPYHVDSLPYTRDDIEFEILLEKATIYGCEKGLCIPGKDVVVVHGCVEADAESMPMVTIKAAPGIPIPVFSNYNTTKTLSLRTTAISMRDVLDYYAPPRKTKIVCTLGPSCWSEEGLAKLLDAGMNVARFNFSHGTHEGHQEVLDRLRKVAAEKKRRIAYLLDTKGPEIRTAMVRDGKNIELVAGQDVILVAVGDDYDKWEGYKDEATGETRIGISYSKLCQSVMPGKRILVSDGSLCIEVVEILSDTELRGRCLNAKSLGPRKNVNLPGVHVDIPVLTAKDIEDLQQFCCKNKMDFVAASFVQTADDVRLIRQVLTDAGGHRVQIISKIENEAGLVHYDDIVKESDGIMVARGDLAMEIPSEKVALAQKMMITKANTAGKFVITATQMLESMVGNPLPTRAEMTDVANAVFDLTDAVMLSGETANGKFPDTAVKTMAAIVANAENANGYNAIQCFIRDHSSKPFTRGEVFGELVASAMVDCNAQLIIVVSEDGFASRLVAKYRPAVPQIVVTTQEHVANQAAVVFGMHAIKVDEFPAMPHIINKAKAYALQEQLWNGEQGSAIVLHGQGEPSADAIPVMRIVDLKDPAAAELLSRVSQAQFSMCLRI